MKLIEIKDKLTNLQTGELIIGSELTGSHACYMIYGVLNPGEKNWLIKPGRGHEEIVLIIKGRIKVTGVWEGELTEGDAFHIEGEESLYFENLSDTDAIYVIAGGHSEQGHHH
ncbi:hypothetical protein TAGGR_1273 [Thermodesulfovibrio aggregans]|uniref:Cupin domain-containing protein n=1 Tax=Thermodesulfovibrio aggregans TaxID=86166 RepID=A0A0U9HWP3_9BACT|nr:hypothetical protein [Thermodesulfovibrio aggregans]GAQ94101.1 hypothetical protein TAGGR_1273 [Thermodesulfovibrio aggregans]